MYVWLEGVRSGDVCRRNNEKEEEEEVEEEGEYVCLLHWPWWICFIACYFYFI